MRLKYDVLIKEGTLVVMTGAILDMMRVYDDLNEFIIDNQYTVVAFGYDPYNAKDFVDKWCSEYGEYGVEKVRQGAITESVPLGELKILAEERALFFDELMMTFTMGNAVVMEEVAFMAWHMMAVSAKPIPIMQQELLDKHFLRKHGKDAYYGQKSG